MPATGPSSSKESRVSPTCVALIGDIVGSQKHAVLGTRLGIHKQFEEVLAELNQGCRSAILSNFIITLGDEFQGLLHDPSVIPDLIWQIWVAIPEIEVRFGIGYGELATPLKREAAIGMDGPAFYRARTAIRTAWRDKALGGVYDGFNDDDAVLGGISRILHEHRSRWSVHQQEVIKMIREGRSQTEIASMIHVTPQAVNARLRTSGWAAYREAEDALRIVLARYATSAEWNG